MRQLKKALPLLCLAAIPVIAQQDSGDEPGERGYPWSRIGNTKNEELMAGMEGAWQLVKATMGDLTGSARSETGVALITKDYMSLEIHMGWSDPLGGLKDWDFQSGTHRITLDGQSVLQLRSVIGSYFDEQGDLEFEDQGVVRSYRPEVHGSTLILTSTATGSRLEFRRMQNPSLDKKRDFFGRPITTGDGETEEPDPLVPPPSGDDD